jgi:hypothetical protein
MTAPNIMYNAPDSEIILPGHTTLALSREALLSLAKHHQALVNAAFAAAMEVAPPIAHPLNDDSLETVNVSRDDPSVAGNQDIGCNNVEPFEIGPEIPTVPFNSIRMSQVTGLKIYEIFRTGHRSPSHVRILKTSHEIAVKWLKN